MPKPSSTVIRHTTTQPTAHAGTNESRRATRVPDAFSLPKAATAGTHAATTRRIAGNACPRCTRHQQNDQVPPSSWQRFEQASTSCAVPCHSNDVRGSEGDKHISLEEDRPDRRTVFDRAPRYIPQRQIYIHILKRSVQPRYTILLPLPAYLTHPTFLIGWWRSEDTTTRATSPKSYTRPRSCTSAGASPKASHSVGRSGSPGGNEAKSGRVISHITKQRKSFNCKFSCLSVVRCY